METKFEKDDENVSSSKRISTPTDLFNDSLASRLRRSKLKNSLSNMNCTIDNHMTRMAQKNDIQTIDNSFHSIKSQSIKSSNSGLTKIKPKSNLSASKSFSTHTSTKKQGNNLKAESDYNLKLIESSTLAKLLEIDRKAKKESAKSLQSTINISKQQKKEILSARTRRSLQLDASSTSKYNSEKIEKPSARAVRYQKQQNLKNEYHTEQPKSNKNKPSILTSPDMDKSSMVSVRNQNGKKIYTCEKCALEFTSANSVVRHQEKSCLRVRVISLKSNGTKEATTLSKKCPICSCTFYNTHRVSIHIYKYHKNLLGSASTPPTNEAKRLNETLLKKGLRTRKTDLENMPVSCDERTNSESATNAIDSCIEMDQEDDINACDNLAASYCRLSSSSSISVDIDKHADTNSFSSSDSSTDNNLSLLAISPNAQQLESVRLESDSNNNEAIGCITTA
jgi:uncharacterized C2H2 Zn-finger protein